MVDEDTDEAEGNNEPTWEDVQKKVQGAEQSIQRTFGCGCLSLLVGLGVTLGTYFGAASGGWYVVMWGAMVFGGSI
jgi:hypothetical protein